MFPAILLAIAPLACGGFDFIIGNWAVKDRNQRAAGTDYISKPDASCTLIEHWSAVGGAQGLAVMTYDSARNVWHRDALLRSSAILEFQGRMSGSSMIMTARQYLKSGAIQLHRISWTPKGDGSIEEVWQTSTDDGGSWKIRFDETLTRVAE